MIAFVVEVMAYTRHREWSLAKMTRNRYIFF
jgi:hypothetical protein